MKGALMDKNYCAGCGAQLGAVKFVTDNRAYCDTQCHNMFCFRENKPAELIAGNSETFSGDAEDFLAA